MWGAGILGGLLLAAATAASGPATGRTLFLEPVDEGVVEGVEDEKCVAKLRGALAGKKLRLVAEPPDPEGPAAREIRECFVSARSRGRSKVGQRGIEIKGPGSGKVIPGGGSRATIPEHEYGVTVEEERVVLLVVRLQVGDRFTEIKSDPRDERLDQAAGTVAKQAAEWLSER